MSMDAASAEKAKFILKNASEDIKEKARSGELSINEAYMMTREITDIETKKQDIIDALSDGVPKSVLDPVGKGTAVRRLLENRPVNDATIETMWANLQAVRRASGQVRESIRCDQIFEMAVADIRPAPENEEVYRTIDPCDPEIINLARQILAEGLLEPLVISEDNYLLSGHRRLMALRVAGLSVAKVRKEAVNRGEDPDRFLKLLTFYNTQRVKGIEEKFREAMIGTTPAAARQHLLDLRKEEAKLSGIEVYKFSTDKKRSKISEVKDPLLKAVIAVLNQYREYWPLTVRQLHYYLLNAPPVTNSREGTIYENTENCYNHHLTDIATRGRIEGSIPWESLHDPSRPVTIRHSFKEVKPHIASEIRNFLVPYHRDLQQSQPNHIEIVVEKNTLGSILCPIAEEYCVPITLGHGYCSLDPRHEMFLRFQDSGKDSFILLMFTDFDPDGEEIASSFCRSMVNDFGLTAIVPVKVALNADQVERFTLPVFMNAKESSSNSEKFIKKHGKNVWELEALKPQILQKLLRAAIVSVMDMEKFNYEVEQEAQECQKIEAYRRVIIDQMRFEIE